MLASALADSLSLENRPFPYCHPNWGFYSTSVHGIIHFPHIHLERLVHITSAVRIGRMVEIPSAGAEGQAGEFRVRTIQVQGAAAQHGEPVGPVHDDDVNGPPSQEDVRSRWARELHDGAVQETWYLTTQLSSLTERVPEGHEEFRGEISRLAAVARHTCDDLRSMIKGLNEPRRRTVDLTSTLADLTQWFCRVVGMNVKFEASEGEAERITVAAESGLEIRRLVQEALWNGWQGSTSDQATVRMSRSDGQLVVEVTDEGRGFECAMRTERGNGWQTMRERAEALRGELQIAASPGNGTRITLRIPLEHTSKGDRRTPPALER